MTGSGEGPVLLHPLLRHGVAGHVGVVDSAFGDDISGEPGEPAQQHEEEERLYCPEHGDSSHQPPATRGHSICLNLPYERGWCDCFCQLMMHCAGKHWSAHSCIMLTVRRGHTPRCSPHTHTCSAHNSPDMIYQGSPHHQVLGANTNIGLGS